MIRRANGLLLLLLGLASGAFALGDSYGFLMNPTFRGLTVGGAALVTILGLAQITRTRGPGSRSTFLIYAGFLVLVAWAQPQRGGIAPLLAPPHDGPPITRAGYATLHGQDLFEDMGTEARTVPAGKVMLRGFVKRLPALDARGEFILLEPSMACCLADAIALGARVRNTDTPLPADGAWVVAFGERQARERPRPGPAVRLGAILFTAVSRTHRLVSDEVVGYLDLLDDLVARVPTERCSVFRALVQQSGLEARLRAEGPFTAFVPLDASFAALGAEALRELRTSPEKARALIERCGVRGRFSKQALYKRPRLEALDGGVLQVQVENGVLVIGGARLLFADQTARNGTVHVVHPIPGHGK
ncbi:MAG: fasciclin domain-containing protein [Planctomycetota bacterium]|nr:fasciclin domain-containing protein [Planctomycetota bacterium]